MAYPFVTIIQSGIVQGHYFCCTKSHHCTDHSGHLSLSTAASSCNNVLISGARDFKSLILFKESVITSRAIKALMSGSGELRLCWMLFTEISVTLTHWTRPQSSLRQNGGSRGLGSSKTRDEAVQVCNCILKKLDNLFYPLWKVGHLLSIICHRGFVTNLLPNSSHEEWFFKVMQH